MENRPKVGLGVYVIQNKKVLMLKRKGAHGEGSWCPPCGHLEIGETFTQCAKREVKEELSIDIKNVKVVGVTNDIFDEEKHYITVAVLAEIKSGKPKIMEADKATDVGWFSINKLPSPLFLPVKHFLKEYGLENK